MRAEKHRHKYRVIAFLLALLLTVSDAGMIALAETEAAYDAAAQAEGAESENSGNDPELGNEEETDPAESGAEEETDPADGTGEEETDPAEGGAEEETDPAESGAEEETDPADGGAEEETDPVDGSAEEETDPAEDDETITEDGQLEMGALPMDISGNNLMLDSTADSSVKPENLVLDNSEIYSAALSWDVVSGAAGYEIQFAIDTNLSPDDLSEDDFYTYITVDPDQAVEETTDESGMSLPIVTVAGSRMTYTFSIKDLPMEGHEEDSYYPTLSQYAVYRVRAVFTAAASENSETVEGGGTESDGTAAQTTYSEFSDYASANGMFHYDKEGINEKRRERFNMPGSGDYERFFLGDADGNEYNCANPVVLHVGESIDNLTLWAVCADGTKVSYPKMRDAIIAAEKEVAPLIPDAYRQPYVSVVSDDDDDAYNYYAFTWAIDDRLAGDEVFSCCTDGCDADHIQPFYQYLGNTVPDCQGIKALAETKGSAWLAVRLNSEYTGRMSFGFFVPIQIKAAEDGTTYPELDQGVIYGTGEEFWAAARQKIRDREEDFIVLMTEETYDQFCDDNEYYTFEEDGYKQRWYLSDNSIMDHWLFTQYAEQEWMEPWAGDNLKDCFDRYLYYDTDSYLQVNGQYYRGIQFSAYYLTTAEQERELDAKIAELLGEGGDLHEAYVSDNKLKKIQAAYNYTRGIKWKSGLDNPLNYTVYSGVVLGQGSCASSSLTFVRLCREMGVNARVVADDYWKGDGDHAWNIVEYKGLWYYVDCTSGKFMKGSSKYDINKQLELYRTEEFTESHPISKNDYVMRKVTYNLNGGTNAAMNPDSFETGDVLAIAPPAKTGYAFEGWYADKAFNTQVTGPEGGDCDTASLTGDLTLYAKWRVNEYILSYDMNMPADTTAKTEAAISDVPVKYNAAVKIAANKQTLYKYAFTGWNTAADGTGTVYKAGASVKNLTSENGVKYTLYAQWAPTTYTVKYDSNNSSTGLSAKGKTAGTTMTFYAAANATAANGFTISGYRFTGWNTRADGKGLKLGTEAGTDGTVSGYAVIGGALESAYARDTKATVTLYAQWEAIPYTVNLHRNDGTDAEVLTIQADTGKALSSYSEANLTRNGYKLSSWNTQPDGKGRKYALTAKNLAKPGEAIDLYAQWGNPLNYKVTYDLQGGRNPSKGRKNPTKYTVVSTEEQRTLAAPAKTGYTFVKWVDSQAEDPEEAEEIKVIPVDECRDIKLRAVWKENSYQVIYHGANDQYTSKTDTVTEIYKYTELADAFAAAKQYTLKDGLEDKVSISAWTTKENGKGTSYAVGKGFSKLSAYDKEDASGKGTVHLYAKWSAAVYRISYKNCSSADGVKNSNAVSYTYNAKKTVSVKAPVRAGYIFEGWSAPEGKDYFDQAKNRIKAGTAEDVALTAKWTPVTYEVKLNLNNKDKGVSFQENTGTVYGSRDGNGIAYDTAENSFDTRDIVRIPEYYDLAGWNTKANGRGIAAKCTTDAAAGEITSVNLSGLCTKNKGTVTLYAIWEPRTYSITYKNVDPDSAGETISELDGVEASNPAEYTYNASKAVKLKNPAKYGFVFEGWYRNYDSAAGVYTDKITSIPKGSYGDITLYGKWRVK